MRAYKDLTSQLSLDRLASLDFLIQNYKLALPSVALPETSPSISHNPRPTSPTLPSTFSASERVLFPMSPFGGPPSLRSPKPGWRSGKSSNLPPQIEPEMPSTDETKQAPPAPRPGAPTTYPMHCTALPLTFWGHQPNDGWPSVQREGFHKGKRNQTPLND